MQTYFISFQNLDFGEGYALSLLITHGHPARLARRRQGRLPEGGVLMSRPGTLAAAIGRIAFILLWSLVPLYWALNISLQTDAQDARAPGALLPADSHPAELPHPALRRAATSRTQIRRSAVNIFIECGRPPS